MAQQRQRMQQIQQWQASLREPRYTPPPHLPEPGAKPQVPVRWDLKMVLRRGPEV